MSAELYISYLRMQIWCTTLNFTLAGLQTTLSALAIHRLRGVENLPRRTYTWACAFIVAVWLSFVTQMLASLPVLLAVYRMSFSTKFWDCMFAVLIATLAALSLLADGLLAFRCWVIWERSRVFIIAAILIVAKFALMVATVVLIANHWIAVHAAAGKRMADTSIALSLTFNVLLAAAAIVRLLQRRSVLRRTTRASGNHYLRVVQIIAGNAVLWTVSCILGIIFKLDPIAAPAVSSVNSFVLATSPLLLFLHIGRQRPIVSGNVVVSADWTTSPPRCASTECCRLGRAIQKDVMTMDEALKMPGSSASGPSADKLASCREITR
ncbi:hypothetical protein AURDEDRAFT_130620 [Auricularia subglabra TFB-10046 SS5]|uniref:G-protein coupled receptors family 1 profile domain-containing protein n=1 Tax=Auricularia subglabra (strain TFB-10046 / SS5) TaxID=717982 RepID=J0CXG6_AURST|nr:hypothetical protein AURDEDRAFT_130620 [Auricularia subglabra TFB-10046 SS5]